MTIEKNRDNVALILPRLGPSFLGADGLPILNQKDPIAQLYQETQRVFYHLHALRSIEVIERMFQYIPNSESIEFSIDEDYDQAVWTIEFPNGWRMQMEDQDPDEPYQRYLRQPEVVAPIWFPRDTKGKAKWQSWYRFFAYQGAFGSDIESKTLNKINSFQNSFGKLSHQNLPALRQHLLDPEWQAALNAMELEKTGTQSATPPRKRNRL